MNHTSGLTLHLNTWKYFAVYLIPIHSISNIFTIYLIGHNISNSTHATVKWSLSQQLTFIKLGKRTEEKYL